jgi:small-conductance mechanosensitive channel
MINMPARKSIWTMLCITLTLGLLAAACSTPTAAVETALPPSETPAFQAEITQVPVTSAAQTVQKNIRNTPTPAPTATPGPVTLAISQLAKSTGADRIQLLGITIEDWLNTLVSLLVFILIILLVLGLLHWLLKRIVALTSDQTDNLLLDLVWPQARWIAVILALSYSTSRLAYIDPAIKQSLDQLYKALIVISLAVAFWKLVTFVVTRYQQKIEPQHEEHQPDHVILLVSRMIRVGIVMVAIAMILSIYSINVDALIAALGIGGLAISLAAKDSLSNMISGLILMLDKPFVVGDRIEVINAGTWGDVMDIGLRSTRIRTRDNRMVFVPNSTISNDRVINYSFQDPTLRQEIDFTVAYSPDIEIVRKVVAEAVQHVEGILLDKPVEVLFMQMGDNGRVIRARWWDQSYVDRIQMINRVNSAIQHALDTAGIEIPTNALFLMNSKKPPESPG